MKRDPARLPFGIFSLDFATGGGCPIWGTTCLWGGESGGKSSTAGNVVSMASRICWRCFDLKSVCKCSTKPLGLKTFWADVEGTVDQLWMQSIGASPESYYLSLADYGEMYVNLCESALRADDCGLVVLDSLAALAPSAEFDAPSEDQFMGVQARMIGRAVRELKQRLIRERKREHPCTVLFTNQLRTKLGVMFGDPSSMPGGHGMKHEFSLLLRMTKKALNDADKKKFRDSDREKDSASRHAFSIKKEKVLTLAGSGEFVRLVEPVKELGLDKGRVDDYGTVMHYAKMHEIVKKDGPKWRFLNRTAKRLHDIEKYWKKYPDEYHAVQQAIIRKAKDNLSLEED
jgi:recombination protein RecA